MTCTAPHHLPATGPGDALALHLLGWGSTCARGPEGWRAAGPRLPLGGPPAATAGEALRLALTLADQRAPRLPCDPRPTGA